MAVLVGNEIGMEVCRALGIDPDHVQRVELDFGVDELVRVKVTRLVTRDKGSTLVKTLESFTFTATGEGETR